MVTYGTEMDTDTDTHTRTHTHTHTRQAHDRTGKEGRCARVWGNDTKETCYKAKETYFTTKEKRRAGDDPCSNAETAAHALRR